MDKVTQALRSLGAFANSFTPHSVGYISGFEPTRADIRDFQDDLYALAEMIDAVFEAYGNHLESIGAISAQDFKDHFSKIVYGAIDGNATFAIESGIEQRIEDRLEAAE